MSNRSATPTLARSCLMCPRDWRRPRLISTPMRLPIPAADAACFSSSALSIAPNPAKSGRTRTNAWASSATRAPPLKREAAPRGRGGFGWSAHDPGPVALLVGRLLHRVQRRAQLHLQVGALILVAVAHQQHVRQVEQLAGRQGLGPTPAGGQQHAVELAERPELERQPDRYGVGRAVRTSTTCWTRVIRSSPWALILVARRSNLSQSPAS